MNLAISQPDHYGFSKIPLTHTFHTNDYEGGIQNWGIAENRQGFIYAANNFGLLEYDGNNWQRYLIENNTRVRSIFIDADDRIYIGGQNQFGYFEPNDTGLLTFHSLRDQLSKETPHLEDIWSIIRYQNQILFCSYQGIISLENNELKYIPGSSDFDLAYEVDNKLYCYSVLHGMAIWDGSSFNLIKGSEFLKNDPVTGIIPHQNHSILIFQKSGNIYQYQQGSFQPWKLDAADFLKASQINKVVLLRNHNIAIGTQNNGLIIISQQGEILKHLTKGKGLNNRTVLALHEDLFQNLWVGLNNGITMVELGSPFSIIDEQSGLPGTGYCAIAHNDKIYLGTSNGLFYQKAKPDPISSQSNAYQLIKNSSGQVYNIQIINQKLMLGHHKGAFWMSDEEAHNFYPKGTWKFAKRINDDRIIAGTYNGFELFDMTNPKEITHQSMGNFNESSRVFEFKNDTTLFMTHGYKGVYKIILNPTTDTIQSVRFYGINDGFPSNILINVFNLGNELLFTAETGIFSYHPQKDKFVHHEVMEKHLGAEVHISELASDLQGNIFFQTDKTIGVLKKTSYETYEKDTAVFSRIRKYLSDDLENIHVIDHENVFFGAKEGFIHYNPSIETTRNQTFSTFIRSVTANTNSEELIYGGAGELPKEMPFLPAYFSSLKFKFASPFYDGQSELLFQYQLENFDKNWSDWSLLTEKEYTNLSQGNYTFHVRAKNVFGNISEAAFFPFVVYPPWYRSKTAYISFGLIVVILFGVSMSILDYKHKRERQKLTISQKRELLKKDHQIVEVSKKSEEEITKLRNDKLHAEIDHKNRELATTTMHLINKNEFMLSVRDSIKEIAKGGSKDSIKKIIRDIDKNMSEDEGWEQFTKHFDQVHGDFLSNIKKDHPTLTPQEIKLCAYLRMNMSSKEIANLLSISVRGVEISRYRLRKKLNISRETNLVDYMLEYS